MAECDDSDEGGSVGNGGDGRGTGVGRGWRKRGGEARACGKRARPGRRAQGARPVRPVRGPAARETPPRKAGQLWQHLRAMHDFRALDAKRGP